VKLAIFLPGMYEGGAERVMLNLAEAILKKGVEIDLVLARGEGPNLPLVPPGVRVIDLHARNTLSSTFPLANYLNRDKPDALLSGLFANIVAIWAGMLSRSRTRLVICEHNTLSEQSALNRADWRFRMMPTLARWFYPRADQIVAVSMGVKQDLSNVTGLPDSRIQVIYNPVITPKILRKGLAHPPHPWFQVGSDPVILAVGRLVPVKEFDALISVFSRVIRQMPSRLMILGEGPERQNLENLIQELGLEDSVTLPGFLEDPYPFISHASLFVLCSRHEGLPGALIEAMAFGIPLVATDCPSGPREILEDGRQGALVPVEDWQALEDAILKGLSGSIPPPEKRAWQRFALQDVVSEYMNVLFL